MIAQNSGSSGRDVRDLPLHVKVQVATVLESRYDERCASLGVERFGYRPPSWDERREGVDTVKTAGGEVLRLLSRGDQSVPKPGWVLVVTGGSFESGYTWTLYGIPPAH